MEHAIEVKGLTKKYDNFSLKGIDLTVPKGYIMGLIGENGAGKSTTIKAILNLIHKDSGTINILGYDHQAYELQIKQQIGVVFDECHFPEQLKPKDLSLLLQLPPTIQITRKSNYKRIFSRNENEAIVGSCLSSSP